MIAWLFFQILLPGVTMTLVILGLIVGAEANRRAPGFGEDAREHTGDD